MSKQKINEFDNYLKYLSTISVNPDYEDTEFPYFKSTKDMETLSKYVYAILLENFVDIDYFYTEENYICFELKHNTALYYISISNSNRIFAFNINKTTTPKFVMKDLDLSNIEYIEKIKKLIIYLNEYSL